jgi:hypothetical protein
MNEIPRMVPRYDVSPTDVSCTAIEDRHGTILIEGTRARLEWADRLHRRVLELQAKNRALAEQSAPIGTGSMPFLNVRDRAHQGSLDAALEQLSPPIQVGGSKKGARSPRFGRQFQRYVNIACPACGAEPGFPCNSSVPLEEWEQSNRLHDARIKKVREGK